MLVGQKTNSYFLVWKLGKTVGTDSWKSFRFWGASSLTPACPLGSETLTRVHGCRKCEIRELVQVSWDVASDQLGKLYLETHWICFAALPPRPLPAHLGARPQPGRCPLDMLLDPRTLSWPDLYWLKRSCTSLLRDWQWKFKDNSIKIHYEEHGNDSNGPSKNILMMPTISDVSTVEEWRLVAKDIVERSGNVNWRTTIVDWPGLGYSDRPKLDYNADVMESFLVDLILAQDSPISSSAEGLVIVGGGHAATLAIRAAKKGLVKPTAIAAVAPTWSGPLPIVFGRDSKTESRYGLLRETLRAPAVGWMMYNMLVSNKKSIQSQYNSHVYADSTNVTPAIIESRYELTKQNGARYVPAAFLTGLLDPVKTREEFLELFEGLEGKLPVLVVSTSGAPKRSKAEMEALREAKGVSKFVEVPGALLPHEEYPSVIAKELYSFLQNLI
ncbi:alpha/beta hydrolases superfamily protein [Tanacetum coccineum]